MKHFCRNNEHMLVEVAPRIAVRIVLLAAITPTPTKTKFLWHVVKHCRLCDERGVYNQDNQRTGDGIPDCKLMRIDGHQPDEEDLVHKMRVDRSSKLPHTINCPCVTVPLKKG